MSGGRGVVGDLGERGRHYDALYGVLQSYSHEQQMEMLAELEGYYSVPVSIDQFLDDPYYLGKAYGGFHEEGNYQGQPKTFPYWRDVLRDIYPNPFSSPYHEICISGAIGTGKTNCTKAGLLYDKYRLTLLKNPQQKYGIGKNTPIVTALFTATKALGESVLYLEILDMINDSPYFRKLYSPKKHQPNIIFPHNLGFVVGSQFKDTLGMAVIQGIIDEANFQNVRLNQVVDNYTNIKRRMVSRYHFQGDLPCRLWIVSSSQNNDSFLNEHIDRSRNNPRTKVIEAALWEVQEHNKEKYCGKKFQVFCGDTSKEPQIIAPGMPIPQSMDVTKIIDVPVEFYGDFEMNVAGALRDLAGKSTTSKYKLFRSREQINKVMIVPPAFMQDVIMLDEYNDKDCIQDYLSDDFYNIGMKGAPHFLHMDTALTTDKFGIAMCHVHGTKEIRRTDHITGQTSVFQEMIVMHDFVLGVQAKPGQEIPFEKVFQFIVWLREMGFNLGSINNEFLSRTGKTSSYDHRTGGGLISVDSFQSRELQQRLRKQGFEVHEVSVDKTKDPYIAFKRAVMEERVFFNRNEMLAKELLCLEDLGKKIDHPDKATGGSAASKDIADAVCASFWSCLENAHSSHLYSDILLEQMNDAMENKPYLWNGKFGTFM
jgi:hypothetical protein